jgi:hypothetical protein
VVQVKTDVQDSRSEAILGTRPSAPGYRRRIQADAGLLTDLNIAFRETARRRGLCARPSLLALLSAIGVAGASLALPSVAQATCVVSGVTVQCHATTTTDTTYPAGPPNDRDYPGAAGVPIQLTVDPGVIVNGYGLSVSNTGVGGVTVTNGGTISVDVGNTPTAGGTAALTMKAAGGPITYTGGGVANNGVGDGVDAIETAGASSVNLVIGGGVSSAAGEGVKVRDTTAGGAISVTTGTVTALTAGQDGIDVQAQSLTGGVTIKANGDVQAGNAGLVGAIIQGAAVGDISVTGATIEARFGVDAENFGSGATSVAVGNVTATSGDAVFALATGGNVTVTTGSASSTGNTAIIARQTKAVGAGVIQVTANGAVSGTVGVEATNSGTGATSVTTGAAVTGTFAEGIKATGNGAVSIAVSGAVTGATAGLTLTGGTGGAGNIQVTGTGGFVGGTGNGATIQNNGSGTVNFNISGATSSAGGEGVKVRDTTAGGAISVTTGTVTALTAGQDGIDVQAQSLTGGVTIKANGDVQAGNAGLVGAIIQGAAVGDISVTGATIEARFGVDAENFGSGATSVAVGNVTATSGNAVFALAAGGNVTVTTGLASSTGNTAIVARQTKAVGAGVIQVTANGAVSGTVGVDVINSGIGAISVTTAGAVSGTTGDGISLVDTTGAINLTTNGAVSSTNSDGIFVSSLGGAITAVSNGTVTGDWAVQMTNSGAAGTINYTANANVTGTNGGIQLLTDAGSDSLTLGAGVTVRGGTTDAVQVIASTSGAVSVTGGTGDLLSNGGDGVNAQSGSGSVTVNLAGTVGAGTVIGADGIHASIGAGTGALSISATSVHAVGDGVDAFNNGTGLVSVTTTGAITSNTGTGIVTRAHGAGTTTITTTGGTVTGGAGHGIDAVTTGGGAIVVTTDAVTGTGAGRDGISAVSNGGSNITVHTNGVVIGGAGAGVGINAASSGGGGSVSVTTVGNVSGGIGIVASSTGAGAVSVLDTHVGDTVTGSVGDGVHASSAGSGAVTVGSSTVSRYAPAVTGATNGIEATGQSTVSVFAGAAVTGATDTGIRADAGTGASTVVANTNVVGGLTGIEASATGAGLVSVTNNGTVIGDGAVGISASNTGAGGVLVTVNNNVNDASSLGKGIVTNSAAGGAININSTALTPHAVTGLGDATHAIIDVTSGAAATTTIHNSANSTITSVNATPAAYGDFAIKGTGGNVVVNNDGRLNGRVNFAALSVGANAAINNTSSQSWHTTGTSTFSAGNDLVNNTGLIATNAGGAATTLDFGAGTDTLANAASGTIVVGEIQGAPAAPGLGTVSTLTVSNLETFTNAGLIVFGSNDTVNTDHQTNDHLLAAGAAYTGSGNSLLSMDAYLMGTSQTSCTNASSVADCMAVGSTAGASKIKIFDTAGAFGGNNPTGILLVGVTGANNANFTLDPTSSFYAIHNGVGVLAKGLFFYALQNTANGTALISHPDNQAYQFTSLATNAQNLWYAMAPWQDRQADLRDTTLPRASGEQAFEPGVWLKAVGDWSTRTRSASLIAPFTFDLSSTQNDVGIIGGVDAAKHSVMASGDVLLGGASVGYVNSQVDYKNSPTHDKYSGVTLAAYGTYLRDRFYVDGMLKADFLRVGHSDATLAPGGYSQTVNGTTVGGQVEAGMRYAVGPGTLEPLGSLAYVSSRIGDFGVPGAVIHSGSNDSFRGSLGLRYAGVLATTESYQLKLAGEARVWDEFKANNNTLFQTGGPDLTLQDKFSGAFGEVGGSLNLFSKDGRSSAFLNTSVKFKSDYTSEGLRVGFRYQW